MSYRVYWAAHISPCAYITLPELESFMVQQMLNILQSPSRQIVEADDSVAARDQGITQVGSKKTCAAGHYDSHEVVLPWAAE